jgi:uncharacterized iron-regulated membrane protein
LIFFFFFFFFFFLLFLGLAVFLYWYPSPISTLPEADPIHNPTKP